MCPSFIGFFERGDINRLYRFRFYCDDDDPLLGRNVDYVTGLNMLGRSFENLIETAPM